ncbi:MAG: hypothetical protein U9O59_07970 [Actinomycetota bacterium]|nr:hypothetical protein [Actinomycetota bacterium]
MNKKNKTSIWLNPVFRVAAAWLWFIIGAAFVILIILAVYRTSFSEAMSVLGNRKYLAIYIEIASAGLLPVLFTVFCRDDLELYGIGRRGILKSLILSGLFAALFFIVSLLTSGQLAIGQVQVYQIDFPWNIWYAVLGIFAYGPLEVFFFVWLVANTDRIFKSEKRILSWGLLITIVIFSLAHVLTTDIYNALYTGALFIIIGLIYKYTGNSIGPMIAWTLINGQVWNVAGMLWS